MKDLTSSNVERQNILNNKYAIERVQEYVGLPEMLFEGEYRFTKQMVIDFFEIDLSTLNRYLDTNAAELKHNGYILSKGKTLKEFKLQFGHLIDKTSKTTQLGLFNFRSFLNLAMLLAESEKARLLRSKILDIVIDTINQRTAIANYLDRKTSEIDELIADKKRLLELYKEEKTAIINQAVTGRHVACNDRAFNDWACRDRACPVSTKMQHPHQNATS